MKRGRIWTPEEDRILEEAQGKRPWLEIADEMGLPRNQIYSRVRHLKLTHPKEFTAEMTRRRWSDGTYTAENNHCFPSGHVPTNKGLKQQDYMSPDAIERSAQTRFVSGHTPVNHKPVGYERITKDGYIEVKTAEPNVFTLKHRLMWSQVNGEIPRGTNIQFKDKDRSNLVIDNLYSIKREDQIHDNSIMRYPEEVRDLIRVQSKNSKLIKNHGT